MEKNLVIKHVQGKQFDVFYGQGWDNWVRVEVNKHPRSIKVLNGVHVPSLVWTALKKEV